LQADGTRLVVKNSFLEVVDATTGLSRSKSDGHLVCALGGDMAQVDAARVAPSNATEGLPPDVDGCLNGSAAKAGTTHHSFSEPVSVGSGSRCHWEEINDCSQYEISGCLGLSDGAQDERYASSSVAPPANHSSPSWEAHELVEQQELLITKEKAHVAGTCKPCFYFKLHARCKNGIDCKFCHLPHEAKLRSRPSKSARLHCKQLLAALDGKRGGDLNVAWGLPSGGGRHAVVGHCMRSPDQQYMLNILRAREREQLAPQGPTQAAPRVSSRRLPRRR